MKQILLIALSLHIHAQVIEFRPEAVTCLDQLKPRAITHSHATLSPNTDKIMKEKKEDRTLLAMVETNPAKENLQIFGFDNTDDINFLIEKFPKAKIYWCFLDDQDEKAS